jgi:SAM-dependent methyltransferase
MAGDLDPPRGSRLSAAVYEPFMWLAERAGMRERRRRALAGARGEVLELGAGTGLNLPLYPTTGIDRLVVTEPEPNMAERLERRAAALGRPVEVVRAPVEALPFDDASFDTVTATLVLCTVADPERSLAEIRRVLRPGGAFLFVEHVRSSNERLARWQDRLHGPWAALADGCNCNRRTPELLRAAGFDIAVEHETWRRMPPLVRPLIAGRAVDPSGGSGGRRT